MRHWLPRHAHGFPTPKDCKFQRGRVSSQSPISIALSMSAAGLQFQVCALRHRPGYARGDGQIGYQQDCRRGPATSASLASLGLHRRFPSGCRGRYSQLCPVRRLLDSNSKILFPFRAGHGLIKTLATFFCCPKESIVHEVFRTARGTRRQWNFPMPFVIPPGISG